MKHIYVLFTSLFLLVSILSYSQDFPTRGEIYDYEVGDEFHRINSDSWGYYGTVDFGDSIFITQEIVDKYYSESGDTLYYQLFIQKMERYYSNPGNNNYSEYYTNIEFANLDGIVEGDEIIEGGSLYNGRKTVMTNYEYGGGTSEEIYVTHSWTVGCGYSLYSRYSWRWDLLLGEYDDHRLVYYKKGDEEWGEEQTIVGLNELNNENEIQIFPNPASDYINIQSQENAVIQIYNSTGQIILTQKTNSSNAQIDVSVLPAGVYFVNLMDEEGLIVGKSKFLKK